jgi:hypothetical protein
MRAFCFIDMPKYRTDRFYFRNGQLRLENRELEGQLHGLCRTWHYNGQIADESNYDHGQWRGLNRQWDENGRLLGSFIISHGTGTSREWHQNGQLMSEADRLDGKLHGRTRIWLRDGTLVQEIFYIGNVKVSRTKYLRDARRHAAWPQYEGEVAGQVPKMGRDLKQKEHKLFIESLLGKKHAEAVQWLTSGKRPELRSLAKFRTTKAALHFVENLYAAGAETVFALPIYAGKRGKLFADWLLVKLSSSPPKRKAVRKLCHDLCEKRDVAMLPEKEMGESHLFVRLD